LQERFKHGASLWAVLRENISLADVFSAFAARERGLVECHMADKVKRVEVFAYFFGQRVQGQAFVFEFFDNGLLALADFQRLRKSSRLAKRFFKAFLVKSRSVSVTSLPAHRDIPRARDDSGPYPST